MRKTVFLIILLLVFNGLVFAQSTGNENRIIGSWQSIQNSSEIWVFNNNGTMTMEGIACRYAITNSQLAIYIDRDLFVYDYSISTDGRTLILISSIDRIACCLIKR